MARIRQIKPEFWSSPSTASASAVARLLFIAMWNWADDSGHGTGNLKELEGFAFPHDDVAELSGGKCRNFRDCVSEVCGSFGVVFYAVRGRVYYEIPSWQNHQRNERLAQGKHPLPEEGEILDMTGNGAPKPTEARKVSEVPQQDVGSTGTVSGVQGFMVSGVQGVMSATDVATPESTFDEFWKLYPRKKGKGEARTSYIKAVKSKKVPAQVILDGVRAHLPEWENKEQDKIPWPATWLNQGRWEDVVETKAAKPAFDPKNWMNQ